MLVSETVRTIAQTILALRPELPPRQRLLLELYALMPLYCEARRLDSWEAAVLAALPNVHDPKATDTSEMGRLLDELFEFGRLNLYTSFNPRETSASYANLTQLLHHAGIACPQDHHFTGF